MKSPWNAYICLVTNIFWSCYCLRFEILRQEKNWYWSWRVMSQYFLLKKNQSTWSSYRFWTLSKQNKCNFFWLLNNMWVFRRLFMSKFNFRRWPMNLVCTPKISNYPAENKEFWEVKKKILENPKNFPQYGCIFARLVISVYQSETKVLCNQNSVTRLLHNAHLSKWILGIQIQ